MKFIIDRFDGKKNYEQIYTLAKEDICGKRFDLSKKNGLICQSLNLRN
jgi:hypothetical protein